jgi:hypothetical protein
MATSSTIYQQPTRRGQRAEELIKMVKKRGREIGVDVEIDRPWALGRRRVGWGDLSWIKNLSYGDRRRAPAFGPNRWRDSVVEGLRSKKISWQIRCV